MSEAVEYEPGPHSMAFVSRHDDVYRRFRDCCPAARSRAHDGFWILSRHHTPDPTVIPRAVEELAGRVPRVERPAPPF